VRSAIPVMWVSSSCAAVPTWHRLLPAGRQL